MGYEPLKSQSKIWISSFVPPSKIFVWEGYIYGSQTNAFWKHFSTFLNPKRVLAPLTSASQTCSGWLPTLVGSAFRNLRLVSHKTAQFLFAMPNLSSCFDFDRHISACYHHALMLSSFCDFDMHIGMHALSHGGHARSLFDFERFRVNFRQTHWMLIIML